MEEFIGSLVSLNCGEALGIYQGKVESINTEDNTLTISNTFRNGVPYKAAQVTLRSEDITDLKIIKKHDRGSPFYNQGNNLSSTNPPYNSLPPTNLLPITSSNFHNIKSSTQPTIFSTSQKHSPMSTPNKDRYSAKHDNHHCNFFQDSDFKQHYISNSYTDPNIHASVHASIHPSKREKLGKAKVIACFSDHTNQQFKNPKQYAQRQRNSECFQRCEGDFDEDFDFEHNLSLFSKLPSHANTGKEPPPRHSHKELKYQCDENIIKGVETSHRQICFLSHAPNTPSTHPLPVHAAMNANSQTTSSTTNNTNKSTSIQNIKAIITISNNTTPLTTISTTTSTTCIMGEYTTDAGLIIPGVSEAIRDIIISTANLHGFSLHRLVEAYGRSISEAVMQYLGGSARFEPKNAHQKPSIVLLLSTTCHSWVSAAALNCARNLANRSAKVKVCFIPSHASIHPPPPPSSSSSLCEEELSLFTGTTTGSVVKAFEDLSLEHGVDLIISTLNSSPQHTLKNKPGGKYTLEDTLNVKTKELLRRVSKLTTPIFTIEPSTTSTFPHHKRSFVCVLPLWLSHPSHGQVCFCDLGIPEALYKLAGVSYKSPFFDRFFLPLHHHGHDHNKVLSTIVTPTKFSITS